MARGRGGAGRQGGERAHLLPDTERGRSVGESKDASWPAPGVPHAERIGIGCGGGSEAGTAGSSGLLQMF